MLRLAHRLAITATLSLIVFTARTPAAPAFANPFEASQAAQQLISQAEGLERSSQWDQASALRRQAVAIFREYEDLESVSIQLSALASNARRQGLLDLALQDLREAALIDLSMERTEWILFDLRDLADTFGERGLEVEQQLALRQLAGLAERRGQRQEAAEALAELIDLVTALGAWRAATEDAAHAVELARPLGQPGFLSHLLLKLGEAQRETGRLSEARAALQEARDVASEDLARARAMAELARVEAEAGNPDTAMALWGEVFALGVVEQDVGFMRRSWEGQIEACLQAGEPMAAVAASERRLEHSRRTFNQTNDGWWRNTVAADLAAHGRVLYEAGNPTGSRATLGEALAAYDQIGNRQGAAQVRLDGAEAALALGQSETALSDLSGIAVRDADVARREAMLAARALHQLGRHTEVHQRLTQAQSACRSLGDREGEVELLQAMAAMWRDGQSDPSLASALSELGGALVALERDRAAVPVYQELMEVYGRTQDLRAWSTDLTNFAMVRERQGEIGEAIALIARAIEIDQQRGDVEWQVIDHLDMARLQALNGDTEGAIASAQRVVELGTTGGNPEIEIQGHEHAARWQTQARDFAAAEASLNSAVEIAKSAQDIAAQARLLAAWAEMSAEAGDWEAASRRGREALEVQQQIGDREEQAISHVRLSVALGRLGQTAEALSQLDQATSLQPNPYHWAHLAAQANRGHLHFESGQGEQAIAEYQPLIPRLRDAEMWELAATILHSIATHQAERGQADLAIGALTEAIDLAERAVEEAPPLEVALYLPEQIAASALYDEIIRLLNEQERFVEALQYSVRQDGSALSRETLQMAFDDGSQTQAATRSEVPEDTPAPIYVEPLTGDPAMFPAPGGSRDTDVNRGDWASTLSGMSVDDQMAFEIAPMDFPYILRHLPDDQTLFVLYHLGSTCHVFFGGLDLAPRGVQLDVDSETIVEQVAEFRRLVREANDALEDTARGAMSQEEYDVFTGRLEGQANDVLATLYRGLVQPLESAVEDYDTYRTVLLYPSGPLRLLPFGALVRTRPDGRREHWVESRDIVYFPAGATQQAQDQMGEPVRRLRGKLLMLAWPGSTDERNFIAYVLEEEERIHAIWADRWGQERVHSLPSDDATIENFMAALESGEEIQMVHLATHGNLRPGDSRESFISLAGRQRLRLDQLWRLPLAEAGTRMAVLSMCNAEYSPDGPADALGTFARSIYLAGCPSVVASLWRVRDESATVLMEQFYENLVGGEMSRVSALSEAQRALIATRGEEPDLSHPFDWAPYVLIGEWR